MSNPLSQPIEFAEKKTGEVLFTLNREEDVLKEILMILSTCHECVLHHNKQTHLTSYQGPSPDEIALVDAASRMGYSYQGIDGRNLIVKLNRRYGSAGERRVEILHSIEFDSDRKRMSVIVRDGGLIKMYVKGADSIIRSRLRTDIPQPFLTTIDASLEEFSLKGLRTLCLAMKVISEAEYALIKQAILNTISSPNAEQAIKNLAEDFERDLILIGGTAVEDRLQDNVPAVLRDFLKANINVWMLTGDKLETAENIARSCNLITKNMGVVYIRGTDTG